MSATQHLFFEETLSDGDSMLRLAEKFGSYGMYHEEAIEDDFGENLSQRHDGLLNFIKTGGRFGRKESLRALALRTNYFRETYAYGTPVIDGIEPLLYHEGFAEGARKIFDRPIVQPAIVYANFLIPGQELAIHTDVPEFRGINRTKDPQWLIVAMHHSKLFDRWRMPIATGVSWFGRPEGGEFAFYPSGPSGPPIAIEAKHDTAILLDTDSVFHGVDRVAETRVGIPELKPGMKLVFDGDGGWHVGFSGEPVERYTWNDLRFSISWKAYCFEDEAEQRTVENHSDDLTRSRVIETLTADLRDRGRITSDVPSDTELALTIIDEYIEFPPANPSGS
jgi:hypothetical protein